MTRTSMIPDAKNEEALPDLGFGEEYEHVITPQMFVVLHRILVRGRFLRLHSLRIGAVSDVPFELENENGEILHYRPTDLDQEPLKQQLDNTGAAAVSTNGPSTPPNAVALPPGINVRLVLRNEGVVPTKPRAALMVQEET